MHLYFFPTNKFSFINLFSQMFQLLEICTFFAPTIKIYVHKMFVTILQHSSSTIAFPGDIIEQQWIDVVSKALKSRPKKMFSSKISLWIVCKGFVVKHSFNNSFFFMNLDRWFTRKKKKNWIQPKTPVCFWLAHIC